MPTITPRPPLRSLPARAARDEARHHVDHLAVHVELQPPDVWDSAPPETLMGLRDRAILGLPGSVGGELSASHPIDSPADASLR